MNTIHVDIDRIKKKEAANRLAAYVRASQKNTNKKKEKK